MPGMAVVASVPGVGLVLVVGLVLAVGLVAIVGLVAGMCRRPGRHMVHSVLMFGRPHAAIMGVGQFVHVHLLL